MEILLKPLRRKNFYLPFPQVNLPVLINCNLRTRLMMTTSKIKKKDLMKLENLRKIISQKLLHVCFIFYYHVLCCKKV